MFRPCSHHLLKPLLHPHPKNPKWRSKQGEIEAFRVLPILHPYFSLVVPLLCLKKYYIYSMTLIKYSALVSGIQGKLNGSVLSTGRSGAVLYNRPRQRKQPTASQLAVRGGFKSATDFWNAATDLQKEDWNTIALANPVPNRFGDLVSLSGYAYYKKMSALLNPLSPGSFIVADTVSAAPYQFTPDTVSADFALTDEGFVISNLSANATTSNDSTESNNWNLYISLPIPQFGAPYFKTWYLVGSGTLANSIGSLEPISFDVSESIQPSGWFTFEGAKHYIKAICFLPEKGQISVDQIWEIESSLVPPVSWPSFTFPADPGEQQYLITGASSGYWTIAFTWDVPTVVPSTTYIEVEFAQAQLGTVPPDPYFYLTGFTSGISAIGSPNYLYPYMATTPEDAADIYLSAYGSLPGVSPDYYIPCRARLYDSLEGTYGPYIYYMNEISGI